MGIVVTGGIQYDIVDIDLGTEHTDEKLMLVGRSLSVLSRTGTIELRINHLRNPLFSLDDVENLSADIDFFESVYFTNTAQTGKTVKLLITRLAGVTARRTLGDVNLDTIGGTVQTGMDLAAVLADLDIAKVGGTAQTGIDLGAVLASLDLAKVGGTAQTGIDLGAVLASLDLAKIGGTAQTGMDLAAVLADLDIAKVGGTAQTGIDLGAVLASLDLAKIGGTAQTGADIVPFIALPSAIVDGIKDAISTTAAPLSATSVPLKKGGLVKVRDLGTGTYIAVGNATSQSFRMDAVKDSIAIDFIDDAAKIYVVTDAGNTGVVEFIGG